MPGVTLPNMPLILPAEGGDIGTWGPLLAAIHGVLDTHRHTGVGAGGLKIQTAGLDINADLTMAGFGLTSIGRLAFSAITALTTGARSLFVSSADNELYWRTNSGTNVKLTDGTALNVAALVGAIGGDYTVIGALLDYDDATDAYRFRQQVSAAVRQYAKLRAGDVHLFEYKAAGNATVPTTSVALKSPTALAASYSVEFPAAVPVSTALVQMSSGGVLTASNTVANAVTLSAGIANNVTLTLGATAASGQHLVVSGTGRFKHPSREINIHISKFAGDSSAAPADFVSVGYITTFAGAGTVCASLDLEVGKRLLTYTQFYNVNSTGASISSKIRRMNLSTGTITDVATIAGDNTGSALESQTASAINHTILTGEAYFIEVTVANASHRVHGATVTYDDP